MSNDFLMREILKETEFNFDGFFYCYLMKVRREESIDFVPIKRLLRGLLEFKAANHGMSISDVSLDDIKDVIRRSDKMFMVQNENFVKYKVDFRRTENVQCR